VILVITVFLFTPANSPAAGKHGPFNLAVTTHLGDAQSFQEGDIVSFYISLDKDAYLTVIYQDAGNRLHLLIPNALYRNNFYKAGLFIPIPNEQNPFQFRIAAPFGKETLWVFASDQPFSDLPPQTASQDSTQLAGDMEAIRDSLIKHSLRRKALFDETSLVLYTSAASQEP